MDYSCVFSDGNGQSADHHYFWVEAISKILVYLGADASCMSGSGSCCFGLFFNKQKAIEAYDKTKDLTYFVKY